jgi:hypothetical protein
MVEGKLLWSHLGLSLPIEKLITQFQWFKKVSGFKFEGVPTKFK